MTSAAAHALLDWPARVPAEVAHHLVDADTAHRFELGEPHAWQSWQRQRLNEMVHWLWQDTAWRPWLAPLAAGQLQALPVMRRADYRALIGRIPARVPPAFGTPGTSETSGSSGMPVRFHFTPLAQRINLSLMHADDRRQGRDPSARVALLTVQAHPPEGPHLEAPGDPWLHPGPHLVRHSAGFSLEENARWLCAQRVRYLCTYPALLSGVLSMIELHGLTAPPIEQVITFAETVDPELRARTRRLLGARITDSYSCEEVGPLAFQCPQSGEHLHVAVCNAIVEVVDEKGRPQPDGQLGSVLVTGLHQWASPALRYELGDVAALLPRCPACGAQVPTLTQLLGRRRVLVERASGELFYVRVQALDWLTCSPVTEWRMVQRTPRDFDVEVVAPRPLTPEEHAAIQAMLARRVGEEFRFALQQRDAIAWPPGRKRQEILGLTALATGDTA